ncbi:polymerase [Mycena latifolia]|nr:polymerase [Mycena latifolia]
MSEKRAYLIWLRQGSRGYACEQNTFETEEESRRISREIILGRVAAVVRKFVRDVSISKGLSETAANAAGGKIFTFGSYRLGIDPLCVVPREDFFRGFEPMVRATEGASEVSGVPGAFIRAKISDVSLDLLVAPIGMSAIPEDLSLKDINVLKNLDETVVRSVNGTRPMDELLRLVPNVPVFRDALRCAKLWAQPILVARICQLYPNAAADAIVSRFFTIMSKWQWPQLVLLNQIEDGPLQVCVWNPKVYPSDKAHRMPIITPNYPSICATHNVFAFTLAILSEQIQNVIAGTASWSELFSKRKFFHKYRNYIQGLAVSWDTQTQMKWAGTVESRMRHLVMKLVFVGNLALAHPCVKGFDRVAVSVLLGRAPASPDPDGATGGDAADAPHKVYPTAFFVGLAVKPEESPDAPPRRLDVAFSVTEFVRLVKAESFDSATMNIALKHIRSTALPNDVFDPGEREATAKITGNRAKDA